MESELPFFTEYTINSIEQIKNRQHIKVTDHVRIYYEVYRDPGNGFEFAVMRFVSHFVDDDHSKEKDLFEQPGFKAEALFYGVARYDGIRHLYMGEPHTNDHGYLYYPDIDVLTKVFTELAKLESQYCATHKKD